MEGAADGLYNAPDRRWQIVENLVLAKRFPARTYGDAGIRRAFRFLSRRLKAMSGDLPQLQYDYPDLYGAYELRNSDGSERWVVDAGLLTSASFEEVGEYAGAMEAVVTAYHDLYFNVRPKLRARGWVLSRILGPAVNRGTTPRDPDFMYKLLGYCAGWQVFKEFLDNEDLSDGARGYLRTNFKDGLLKRGWAAVHRIEVNNFTALGLIEMTLKLIEIEMGKGGEAGREGTNKLLQGLVDSCESTLLRYDSELPQDELRMLKYGDPIPLTAQPALSEGTPAGSGG